MLIETKHVLVDLLLEIFDNVADFPIKYLGLKGSNLKIRTFPSTPSRHKLE